MVHQQADDARVKYELASHPGYCLTFHQNGGQAPLLLIGFGSVGSSLVASGFGSAFAAQNGYDHIYVGQRSGSQYQELPLKVFQELVEPYSERYQRVVAYGASLGGTPRSTSGAQSMRIS